MVDVDIPRDEIVDPPALRAGPAFPWYDRSRCRTPMQWAPGAGAGFTTGRPWLRIAPDADRRNVEVESRDPGSVLATYRRLLAFRATAESLRTGQMERLDSGDADVLAWTRTAGRARLLVVVSFVGEPRTIDVGRIAGGGWTARVGSHQDPAAVNGDGRLALRPDEAVILEAGG